MKDISENYIQVQGWMISKLKLSGNELLCYALIFGFSQDGNSKFQGSINYICTWLNCSRPTAIKSLKSLVEKGYLNKEEVIINGVKFNTYNVFQRGSKETLPPIKNLNGGSKETLPGGSKETLPNNTNNNNNNIDSIDKKFNFKKEFFKLGVEKDVLEDWLKVRKSKNGVNTKTAFNKLKKEIEKSRLSANECIRIAAEKSWSGFNSNWIKEKSSAKKEKPKSRLDEFIGN